MSFDYDKIKNKEENGSHWASYSDLFMVLSLVFLLLYVVTSLRGRTGMFQSEAKFQEVTRERDDLKQQIKVYNTLKDNYIETGATEKEQKMYKQLTEKIVLLKDEAKKEKEDLREAANENAKKEIALNEYQKMIRNIVNANMVSSARLKRKNRTIAKNYKNINQLESTVEQKQKELEQRTIKIKQLNSSLDSKVKDLKKSFAQNKISKRKMEQKIAQLKENNNQKIKSLESSNLLAKKEIEKQQQEISQKNQELAQAESKIKSQENTLNKLNQQKQKITQNISNLREQFQKDMNLAKKRFQSELEKEKMTSDQKDRKTAEFLKKSRQKEEKLAGQIQNMEAKVQETQGQLENARQESEKLAGKAKELENAKRNLASANNKLSEDVKRLQGAAEARNQVVADMKKELKKAGLDASVDGRSGDVVIAFGDEYFDTGKAHLKPGMIKVLKKFMPAYSKSLFSKKEIANKISSVEIIGFASPTYKGKYVNPVSLEVKNKEAVNYNLDLSYYRARSIFDYIFDTGKMKYKYQKNLLPIVKVTGRSFLAEDMADRNVTNMSNKEYCKKYDCKKSQKVVIKFNLKK